MYGIRLPAQPHNHPCAAIQHSDGCHTCLAAFAPPALQAPTGRPTAEKGRTAAQATAATPQYRYCGDIPKTEQPFAIMSSQLEGDHDFAGLHDVGLQLYFRRAVHSDVGAASDEVSRERRADGDARVHVHGYRVTPPYHARDSLWSASAKRRVG